MVVAKVVIVVVDTNNKKNTSGKNHNRKIINGKINVKKVFSHKNDDVIIEETSISEALVSRAKKNQKRYYKSNGKVVSNDRNLIEVENFSSTKQQKFNFDNKKVKIEDDESSYSKKKDKSTLKEKIDVEKPINVNIEDTSIKKSFSKVKNKKDSIVFTMFFLIAIIVFMGIFLVYYFSNYKRSVVNIKYKMVEVVPENIVFLGDSITDFYDLDKYYPKRNVVNSGVSGNTTQDILNDMENRVYRYNPSIVFLLIGTNDLTTGDISIDDTIDNIKKIIKGIKKNLPKTIIYLESIYPINNSNNEKIDHQMVNSRNNEDIQKINKELRKFAKKTKINYVDVYDKLVDKDGNLSLDYTKEGLHLNDEGYEKVTFVLKKVLKKTFI